MTDTKEMINAVERALTGTTQVPKPVTNGSDVGASNIRQAGGLSSNALREAFEECAKRALELANANLEQAKADKRAAEQFCVELREYGARMSKILESGFARASTMASTLSANQALIQPERD